MLFREAFGDRVHWRAPVWQRIDSDVVNRSWDFVTLYATKARLAW